MIIKFFGRALLFFLSLIAASGIFSANQPAMAGTIEDYLRKVAGKADSIKMIDASQAAAVMTAEIPELQFSWSAEISAEISDSELPATSPFSASQNIQRTVGASVSRLWESGVQSKLSYSFLDNFTDFPTRSAQDYFLPQLKLSLSADIIRDLFSGRYAATADQVPVNRELALVNAKLDRKQVFANALLTLGEYLQLEDDLKLQNDLCGRVQKQTQTLARKQRRGSIAKRDYLISRKEANGCEASLNQIRKQIVETKESAIINFGVSLESYKEVDVAQLFQEVIRLVQNFNEVTGTNLKMNTDDLRALELDLEVSSLKQIELDAAAKVSVNLEMEASYSGIDPSIGGAHKDLTRTKYPSYAISLTLPIPFRDPEARKLAAVNRYTHEIKEIQLRQLKDKKRMRLETLRTLISKDLEIYKSYKESVELSQDILQDARRDFENGRINFFNLSEFQKQLIESQQRLSSIRTALIVEVVEFVDYFNYFDAYSGAAQ